MQNNNQQPNKQNSMFRNPEDEELLCQVLKAFVEEWGPEHVYVSVPTQWQEYGTTNLGRVSLSFETKDSVVIYVIHEEYGVTIEYKITLALV